MWDDIILRHGNFAPIIFVDTQNPPIRPTCASFRRGCAHALSRGPPINFSARLIEILRRRPRAKGYASTFIPGGVRRGRNRSRRTRRKGDGDYGAGRGRHGARARLRSENTKRIVEPRSMFFMEVHCLEDEGKGNGRVQAAGSDQGRVRRETAW